MPDGWINVTEIKSEAVPPMLLELLKNPKNISVVADPKTFKTENPAYAMVVTEKLDIPYGEQYLKIFSTQLAGMYKKYKDTKILNKKIETVNGVMVFRFLIENKYIEQGKTKSFRILQYIVPYGRSGATLGYSCESGQYKKYLAVFEDSVAKTVLNPQ